MSYTEGTHLYAGGEYLEWGIVKLDHKISEQYHYTKGNMPSATVWKARDSFPSEVVFVANPNGELEDDGVLLSQVFDSNRNESYLLVLDAKTLNEVARAYTGIRIPVSLHGQFYQKLQ